MVLLFCRFGNMVAFFRYSPINILTVFLPPSMLEFNSHPQPEWIRTEAAEVTLRNILRSFDICKWLKLIYFSVCGILQLMGKMRTMYEEVSVMIKRMEEKSILLGASELQSRIMGLKDQLVKEKDEYDVSISLLKNLV